MDKTKLVSLVKAEAKLLKKFATIKQINKLDKESLNANSVWECIYGQMTGNCFGNAATELIKLSCKKVYYKNENRKISGNLSRGNILTMDRELYWSPIEVFIDQDVNTINGNNTALIAYLKGETKTLKFTKF